MQINTLFRHLKHQLLIPGVKFTCTALLTSWPLLHIQCSAFDMTFHFQCDKLCFILNKLAVILLACKIVLKFKITVFMSDH